MEEKAKKRRQENIFSLSTKVKYSQDHNYSDCLESIHLKVEFFVNEEKRTTMCILTDSNIISFYDLLIMNHNISLKDTYLCKQLKFNSSNEFGKIVAKSVCHPDDKFDQEEGMRVAFRKAARLRYNIIKELVRAFQNNVYRNFNFEMKIMEERIENLDKLIEYKHRRKSEFIKRQNMRKVYETLGDKH